MLDAGVEYLVAQKRCDAVIASNTFGEPGLSNVSGKRTRASLRTSLWSGTITWRYPGDLTAAYDHRSGHESYAKAAVDLLIAVASGQRIRSTARVVSITPNLVVRASS